jgi:hypothetical protein
MMMMVVFIMEANEIVKKRFVWNYERTSGFKERQFLGSDLTKMFKQ